MELAQLERSLEADLALSLPQVRRHYGLTLGTCLKGGFTAFEAEIGVTARSRARRRVTFILREAIPLEPFELRHLAGVAEARHRLQARPEDWEGVGHAAHTAPDAVWHRGLETWAIEYDAGGYSLLTVQAKAAHFRAAFDAQIWACGSSARCSTLAAVLGDVPLVVAPF